MNNLKQQIDETNESVNQILKEQELALHLFQHKNGCEFTMMPKSNLAPFQRDIHKECHVQNGEIYKGSWKMHEDGFMLSSSFLATCSRSRKIGENTRRVMRLMDANFEREVA
jgi:hypothetical protein